MWTWLLLLEVEACFVRKLSLTSWTPLMFLLLLLLLSWLQAQNTQQTGFKGNLRLLVKTLEQPHLPFKILPAALSHCLHADCLLMLAASTAFHFTPHGPWAREDTLLRLYKSFIHAARYLQERARNGVRGRRMCVEYEVCFCMFQRYRPMWWNQRALLITTDSAILLKPTCQSFSIPSSAHD